MKKKIAAVAVAVAATTTIAATPASASWGDVQLVKDSVESAYYGQSSYTKKLLCRKWRRNYTGPVFMKVVRIADRMYGISTKEAVKGTVLAFNGLCGRPYSVYSA